MNKNQIVIHASGKQTRIALIENGELAQFFIESPENRRSVGDIYLAEVHKVMSGIRAAFIDMGTPKDAFLHFSDLGEQLDNYLVMLNGRDTLKKEALKAVDDFRKKNAETGDNDGARRSTAQEQNLLGSLLQPKQKMLVQIVKEPIGNKGPRVSTDITLPGRLLVLIPMGNYVAVSKRIRSFKERRRLRSTLNSMLPKGFGVIVRTVADGQDEAALGEDLKDLLNKWKDVMEKLKDAKPTTLLHRDLDMTESLVRDLFSKNYDRILIDDPAMGKQLKHYISRVAPDMVKNIELYKSKEHIFEHMKIARDVESIFSPRVKMPSGGYLIFEQTEAMYVVDVNSGRYAAKKIQEDNSLRTNLEAAREIAKQLRLRDIGGIIVVDFIDLQDDSNRKKVYDELKKEFRKDRAKTNLLPMSDFGLVQITRQRIRPSVVKSVSLVCPMCGGSGSIVSQNTVLSDIETWLSKYAHNYSKRSIDLYVNPYFHSLLTRGILSQRLKWIFKFRFNLSIIPDETVSLNEFKVTLMGTDVDITQTVQEGTPVEMAEKEAEKRLAELESGGQRDDSLLDYGSSEKGESDDSRDRDKDRDRDRSRERDRDKDKQQKRPPSQSRSQSAAKSTENRSATSKSIEETSKKLSSKEEEDGRKGHRQDSRRSNVKSKYYKTRQEESDDQQKETSSRSSSEKKNVTDDTGGDSPSARTESNGEPLRNAEDVAREYREKRLKNEALQKENEDAKSGSRKKSDDPEPEPDSNTVTGTGTISDKQKDTKPSKTESGTEKKEEKKPARKPARSGKSKKSDGSESGDDSKISDEEKGEAKKAPARSARPKKANQESGEESGDSTKAKPAAKKPAARRGGKAKKTEIDSDNTGSDDSTEKAEQNASN